MTQCNRASWDTGVIAGQGRCSQALLNGETPRDVEPKRRFQVSHLWEVVRLCSIVVVLPSFANGYEPKISFTHSARNHETKGSTSENLDKPLAIPQSHIFADAQDSS